MVMMAVFGILLEVAERYGIGAMRLPREPRSDVYSLFSPYLADPRNEAWRSYLFLGHG